MRSYFWLVMACGDDPQKLSELGLLLAAGVIVSGQISLLSSEPADLRRVSGYREALDDIEARLAKILVG